MPSFAIVVDDTVVNAIVAETIELAAQIAEAEAIEIIEGVPSIQWRRVDGAWIPPQPYESWVWDGADWQPPIPAPSPSYYWNESAQDWAQSPQPFASHSWNAETQMWEAPIAMPTDAEVNQKYLWSEELLGWVLTQDGPDL